LALIGFQGRASVGLLVEPPKGGFALVLQRLGDEPVHWVHDLVAAPRHLGVVSRTPGHLLSKGVREGYADGP
jgi:hypothetical protein